MSVTATIASRQHRCLLTSTAVTGASSIWD